MYTAVLGVYAFWGPKAGKRIYNMSGESADVVFGGVTVLTGVFGSLAGGLLLDRLGSTLSNANLVCGVSNLVGLVFVLVAFLAAQNFTVFIVLFALGELALFMLQAPVGAIGMWAVPPALRPLAISMVTVSIHLLGDVPSPPLIGALQSALERGKPPAEADQQWRITMSIISLLLFFSGCTFLRGSCVSRKARDYRKDDELAVVAAVAQEHQVHIPHGSPHVHGRTQGQTLNSNHLGTWVDSSADPGPDQQGLAAADGPRGMWFSDSSGLGHGAAGDAGTDKQPLLDPEDPGSLDDGPAVGSPSM